MHSLYTVRQHIRRMCVVCLYFTDVVVAVCFFFDSFVVFFSFFCCVFFGDKCAWYVIILYVICFLVVNSAHCIFVAWMSFCQESEQNMVKNMLSIITVNLIFFLLILSLSFIRSFVWLLHAIWLYHLCLYTTHMWRVLLTIQCNDISNIQYIWMCRLFTFLYEFLCFLNITPKRFFRAPLLLFIYLFQY